MTNPLEDGLMKQSYVIAAAAVLPFLAIVAWFGIPLVSFLVTPTKPEAAVVQPQAEPEPAPEPEQTSTDPYREIKSSEMTACWMFLRDQMNDPRSFRVLNKDRRNGGIVEFTATNGFGGTIRQTYRCTTGQLSQ